MRKRGWVPPAPLSIKDWLLVMGQIKLDRRGGKAVLTFLVRNGKKLIPKLVVELEDFTAEQLDAAISEALGKLRPARPSLGGLTDDSPG